MVTFGGAVMVPGRMLSEPPQSPAKVPRGAVRHPPIFQACASVDVYSDQSVSSTGRRRSMVGRTANAGPVRSFTDLILTRQLT